MLEVGKDQAVRLKFKDKKIGILFHVDDSGLAVTHHLAVNKLLQFLKEIGVEVSVEEMYPKTNYRVIIERT